MQFEYMTVGMAAGEKWIGKSRVSKRHGKGETEAVSMLADKLNALGAQGWELVNVAVVPTVGKLLKDTKGHGLTVAFLKRQVA